MKEKIKSFTIEGSLPLKEAFIKELGLEQATVITLIGEFVRIQNGNSIVGNWNKQEKTHFNLNSQYGEAIAFFKEMVKEEPIIVKNCSNCIYQTPQFCFLRKQWLDSNKEYEYPCVDYDMFKSKEKEVIEVEVPEGYEDKGELTIPLTERGREIYNGDLVVGHLFKIKETKTPEQLANELGFRIGDKCWCVNKKDLYLGELIEVYINKSDNFICGVFSKKKIDWQSKLVDATNKVAIHTSTKEEFEFICKKLHPKENWFKRTWNYVAINDAGLSVDNFKLGNPYDLILTVEEYLKSIGETPILTTVDEINIYDKDWIIWFYDNCGNRIYNNHASSLTQDLKFNTEKAAYQYIASLEEVNDGNYNLKLKRFKKVFNAKKGTFESLLADNYAKVIKEYEDKKDFLNQKKEQSLKPLKDRVIEALNSKIQFNNDYSELTKLVEEVKKSNI